MKPVTLTTLNFKHRLNFGVVGVTSRRRLRTMLSMFLSIKRRHQLNQVPKGAK